MNRLADYLSHILEAISRIQVYTANIDETAFLESTIVQDAVIRNIEIIGEASRNIAKRYPEFAAAHPNLDFGLAYAMRNAVSHGYFSVDFERRWSTLQTDLPVMRDGIEAAMAEFN